MTSNRLTHLQHEAAEQWQRHKRASAESVGR